MRLCRLSYGLSTTPEEYDVEVSLMTEPYATCPQGVSYLGTSNKNIGANVACSSPCGIFKPKIGVLWMTMFRCCHDFEGVEVTYSTSTHVHIMWVLQSWP